MFLVDLPVCSDRSQLAGCYVFAFSDFGASYTKWLKTYNCLSENRIKTSAYFLNIIIALYKDILKTALLSNAFRLSLSNKSTM